MYIETSARSIVKAISWRVIATLTTGGLVFAFTGKALLALGVGSLEVVSKLALYYFHERAWNRIRYGRRAIQPAVMWLTGLPASGKTTLAEKITSELGARVKVEHLDGDTIRDIFPNAGFTREERDEHVRRVGHLASRLEAQGVFVVVSLVSPYADSREAVRGMCKRFVEVHLATPLAVCEQRDPKGLYARARRGELKGFTGIDDPYEPPTKAEVTIDTTATKVEDGAARVVNAIGLGIGL